MLELVKLNNKPEMFAGIQGEGVLIGQPTFFIRLAKCNLKCSWCDSNFSWTPGIQVTTKTVADAFIHSKMKSVTVTGGEPMLQQQALIDLAYELFNIPIYVETNGTIWPTQKLMTMGNVYFTVSPKLSNSGMVKFVDKSILSVLSKKCTCFKFVVGTPADIDEALLLIKQIKLSVPVVFQPLGQKIKYKQILKTLWNYVIVKSKETERDLRFLPQWHVVLFGQKRGV